MLQKKKQKKQLNVFDVCTAYAFIRRIQTEMLFPESPEKSFTCESLQIGTVTDTI